jgi:replicative DNA helicase
VTVQQLPDHLPPQAIEAEMATLGAALISRSATERMLDTLSRDDFYVEAHRKVFDAIAALANRDITPDTLTVPEELRRREQLDLVGGLPAIIALVDAVPTAAHVDHYARMVADKATLRKLILASHEIIALAHDTTMEVIDVVDEAERRIFEIGRRRLTHALTHIRPVVFEALERLETVRASDTRLTGVPTGFEAMDRMTSGLQAGDLVIVAGRPSMGKTSLALGMAVNAAAEEHPVAIFSLEMSREQLAHRMICSEAKVDSMRLRTGFLHSHREDGESDFTRLGRACGRLGDLPIYIDDSSDVSVLDIRTKCRRMQGEHGLGMVVVDYLQLVRGHGRPENRNQEISLIARSLKSMARELHVPVVALSQLSRAVEQRQDKRPMLSDLRESGSIEAEADLVMMLWRSRYYNREEAEEASPPGVELVEEAEINVAKHRNGPTGTIRLGFLRRYARFEDLAEDYGEER